MTSRRQHILNNVSDLASDFLYYDRKDCESLPRGEIEKAVAAGEITKKEIVDLFAKELGDLKEPA